MFSVILYTHTRLDTPLLRYCTGTLYAAVNLAAGSEGSPPDCILTSSELLTPPPGWRNLVATGQHGLHDCYTKIAAALAVCRHDLVWLAEHDVLYPPDYFQWAPPDGEPGYWFNTNVWRANPLGYWPDPTPLTSQCCARRQYLVDVFARRLDVLARGGRIVWDEPGRDAGDPHPMREYRQPQPSVDVRHGENLTGMRTGRQYSQTLAPWPTHSDLWAACGLAKAPAPAASPKPAPRRQNGGRQWL